VRLAPFGAFVEITKGVEGLVHISEMGQGKRIRSPREVVREGARVTVKVLSVDADKRRIGLSLNDVDVDDGPDEESRDPGESRPEASMGQGSSGRKGGTSLGTFADLFKEKLKK
jgi:small subunit ribosomal protein S1